MCFPKFCILEGLIFWKIRNDDIFKKNESVPISTGNFMIQRRFFHQLRMMSDVTNPVYNNILQKLSKWFIFENEKNVYNFWAATFEPIHLEVINESHMHSVPKNSETHFKVKLSHFSEKIPRMRARIKRSGLVEFS